jgi:diacylglycerol kinase (ATP)
MTSALVIVNPAAGGGRAARTWQRASTRLNGLRDVECVMTQKPGHARALAREAAAAGCERIIAVGGDGTISEVADGLAGSQAILGIVPAGSGNDFSCTLGLPSVPELAVRVALHGDTRMLDLGHVQTASREVAFVNVAGCGFDAEVVRRTPSSHMPGGGTVLYLAGVLRTLAAFRPRPVRFAVDGRAFERRVLGVAVAIGPRYGGGLRIAPRAVLDDGLFDVCVVGDVTPFEVLLLLPLVYAGRHGAHRAVEFFRCRELAIEPLEGAEVSCQADGELLERLPATFTIQSHALRCAAGEPS